MTYRTRQCWHAIPERRRFVVCTRTPGGAACTIVVERDASGLIVSFHGAMRTTAAPDPAEATELIEALRTAVGAPS